MQEALQMGAMRWPNPPRQPAPVERQFACSAPAARHGCAFRSALAMRAIVALLFIAFATLVIGCRPARWVELELDDGNFSFSMPARPTEKQTETDLPLGHLKMLQYTITTNEITFMLNYIDYPERMTAGKSADDMLDPGLDKVFSAYPRARKESAKIVLQGFPGRRFSIEDPGTGSTTIAESCLVGRRIYLLQAVMPTRLSGQPEVQRFISSLRLKSSGSRRD